MREFYHGENGVLTSPWTAPEPPAILRLVPAPDSQDPPPASVAPAVRPAAVRPGRSGPAGNRRASAPVSVRAGDIEFLRLNSAPWNWRDTYHRLLTLSWPRFALFLLCAYLGMNAFFAVLYHFGGGHDIAGMRPGSYADAFFFSVETLATVGYGHMYPVTTYGHLVATAEILLGMFLTAVMTGLIFVRFSRPTAHVDFSRTMVLSNFDGRPALQIRVANQRNQSMVEAEFHLMLIRLEWVAEGEFARRFYELPLQVERVILFPAALTLRHIIDERSPLYGCTPGSLTKAESRFMASVVCVDTVVPAAVQSQQSYRWDDVRFGERFVEIYTEEGARLVVDYGRLHDTEPVPLPLPAGS